MDGFCAFYPMVEKIGENQANDYKIKELKDEFFFENENNFDYEEDLQNSNDNLNDFNQSLINERAEEYKTRCQNQANEMHQKEYTRNIEKTAHYETSTKFKTELTVNEDEKEIYEKIKDLNQKRAKTNDKGKRINQILNRIKDKGLDDIHHIASEMIKKTEYYKYNKKILAKIDNSSYKFENSSANLLFLNKKIKEVLSEKKENEEIIWKIMSNNDYPVFIKFLNMTIENFFSLYFDECDFSEQEKKHFSYLKDSYKKLIDKMRNEGKSKDYIDSFIYFTAHIKNAYISINEHKKNKCKNI
jgi:hypothetical protein